MFKQVGKKKFLVASTLIASLVFGFGVSPTHAHPGGTDDKGGHVCRTNCDSYGLKEGEYHTHPKIKFNGETMAFSSDDTSPVIVNGTTLVPMRTIFEALGAEIVWDAHTSTVTATKSNNTIILQIGRNYATVNGQTVDLSLAPQIMGGRTMVPLRFVSEAMGADVTFDSSTNTITIVSSLSQQPTPSPEPTPNDGGSDADENSFSDALSNLSTVHVANGKSFKLQNLHVVKGENGLMNVLFDIDPNDYSIYLENFFEDRPYWEEWGKKVVEEYDKHVGENMLVVGVYYADTWSILPTSFESDEVRYIGDGKYRVLHGIVYVYKFTDGSSKVDVIP